MNAEDYDRQELMNMINSICKTVGVKKLQKENRKLDKLNDSLYDDLTLAKDFISEITKGKETTYIFPKFKN